MPHTEYLEIIEPTKVNEFRSGLYQNMETKLVESLTEMVKNRIGRTPTREEIIQELTNTSSSEVGGTDYIKNLTKHFLPIFFTDTKISKGSSERLYFEIEYEFHPVRDAVEGKFPYYSSEYIEDFFLAPPLKIILSPIIKDLSDSYNVHYEQIYNVVPNNTEFATYINPYVSNSDPAINNIYIGGGNQYSPNNVIVINFSPIPVLNAMNHTLDQTNQEVLIFDSIELLPERKMVICVSLDYMGSSFSISFKDINGNIIKTFNDKSTTIYPDYVYDEQTMEWVQIMHTEENDILLKTLSNYDFTFMCGDGRTWGWDISKQITSYIGRKLETHFDLEEGELNNGTPSWYGPALTVSDLENMGCIIKPHVNRSDIRFLPSGFIPINESSFQKKIKRVLGVSEYDTYKSGGY